jgi:hypothetical protein
MTDPIIHPRFTLHFGDVPTGEAWSRNPDRRKAWILNSTHLGWETRHSGRGNVNRLEQIEWAKEWAAEEIRDRTSYEVVGWVDPVEGDTEPFWAPRLVHVKHGFRIADSEGEVSEYTALSRADANAVQERFLHESGFVRLVNAAGNTAYINTRHVIVAVYIPVRTEVPL